MKVVLRSSSLPLTLLGILMNVGVARVDTGLRRGIVGRLRIGMSVEEVQAELGADPAVNSLVAGPEPGIAAEFLNGSLVRCQVVSRRYRTPEGIGVGSSGPDLERAYSLIWEEPGVAYIKSLRMRFIIQEGKIAKILVS
jgi:hypothetical protein